MLKIYDQTTFLSLFTPPQDYGLNYCIGTSYSIDLEVLTQLAFSLGKVPEVDKIFSRDTNGQLVMSEKDSYLPSFLAALEEFGDKAVIFCQACRFVAPEKWVEEGKTDFGKLLQLLDETLVAVPTKEDSSFHAKLWFLRFDPNDSRKKSKWRLIVTSRNLTQSKTWEVQASLESTTNKSKKAMIVDGLPEFLEMLSNQRKVTGPRKTLLNRAILDAKKVHFELPHGFKKAGLKWCGPKRGWLDGIDPDKYEKMILVSPFLGDKALKKHLINKNIVVTGKKNVSLLEPYLSKSISSKKWLKSNHLLCAVGDLDLHAKLYIGRTTKGNCDLYLGSANLTNPAMGNKPRNTECLIHFYSDRDLLSDFENNFLFQETKKYYPWIHPVDTKDIEDSNAPESEIKNELDKLQRKLGKGIFELNRNRSFWFMSWRGIDPHIPTDVEGKIRILGQNIQLDLKELITGTSVQLEGVQDPSAFIWIELKKGPEFTIFFTVAEVIGNRSGRIKKIVETLSEKNSLINMLNSLLSESGYLARTGTKSEPVSDSLVQRPRHKNHNVSGYLEAFLLADLSSETRIGLIDQTLAVYCKNQPEEAKPVQRIWKKIKPLLKTGSK